MLEDLAIQFLNQSDDTFQQIILGLIAVGAIIAAIVTRSKAELACAPYFAYTALVSFVVSTVQIVWLQSIPAISGGYLWVLMTISLAALVAGGFFFCYIAIARSRDAYGHGRMAFLTFIPIANFWLLLTPSKNATSANRAPTIPLLSGGLGVLTGLVLLAGAISVTIYIDYQGRMMDQQAQTEPISQQAAIDSLIRSRGLEETLRLIVVDSQTPIVVDELTTLSRIDATGTQLRRTYVVDLEDMIMTEEFHALVRNSVCAWPAFEPILLAGGSIQEVYIKPTGREIGVVMITRTECGL